MSKAKVVGVPENHLDLAAKDYHFARFLLIQSAISNEYIADAPFSLPSKRELAQRLQDMARLACFTTNQDGVDRKYDSFGDDPEEVYQRILRVQNAKVTPAKQRILRYLNGKSWTSPTKIGVDLGMRHSAWASPHCLALVKLNFLSRNAKGWYRIKKVEKSPRQIIPD